MEEDIKTADILQFVIGGKPIDEFEKKFGSDIIILIAEYINLKNGIIGLNSNGEKKLAELAIKDIVEETQKIIYVPPKTSDEVGSYDVKIRGKILKISINDLMTPTKFKSMYYDRFSEFIKISPNDWKTILDAWGEMREVNKNKEIIDNEQCIIDNILKKLQECAITKDITKCANLDNFIYFDDNGSVYYPSRAIHNIIKISGFRINMERLRILMHPYINENTQVKRVGKSTMRFWVFSPEKCDIDINEIEDEIKPS